MRVRTYSGSSVCYISNFVTQLFFDDAISNVPLATAAYSRTSARDTTNATDNVYRVANADRMLLTLAGDTNSGYTASITAGAFQTATAASPSIAAGGVALSGAAGVAPGALISIYGSNFSRASRTLTSSDLVKGAIPTSLGGVSVNIGNKAAYIQYVSPTQINVIAPQDSSLGPVAVTVTNSVGSANSMTASMQSVLPGLAVISNYVRAVRCPDSAIINGTGAAEFGYTTSDAIGPGDILALYGTGFGPTTPSVDTGIVFTGSYPTTNPVTVTIGGVSATVLWAGLGGPGLYQINVAVPPALSDGDQTVIATVAGASTQSTALLKVAASAKLSAFGLNPLALRLLASRASAKSSKRSIEDLVRLAGLTGPLTLAPQEGRLVQMKA